MRKSPERCRSAMVSSGMRRSASVLAARSRSTGPSRSARSRSSSKEGTGIARLAWGIEGPYLSMDKYYGGAARCQRALPLGAALDRREAIEPRRVLDQDLAARVGVGGPGRQQVHHPPVVDRQRRRDVPRLAARHARGVRMRPIGAPYAPLGIGGGERLCEPCDRGPIRRLVRGAVAAGDLHIGLAGLNQRDERAEARLLGAELGARAAEMIEDQRDRLRGKLVGERGDDGEAGIYLDVPTAIPDAVDRHLQLLGRGRRVELAGGLEIDAHAANAGLL